MAFVIQHNKEKFVVFDEAFKLKYRRSKNPILPSSRCMYMLVTKLILSLVKNNDCNFAEEMILNDN